MHPHSMMLPLAKVESTRLMMVMMEVPSMKYMDLGSELVMVASMLVVQWCERMADWSWPVLLVARVASIPVNEWLGRTREWVDV